MRPHSTKNQRRKPGRRAPVLMILVGAALLALVGALFALTRPPAPYTPEVTGSPNLKVDREVVDLGDVKLGTPEKVVFHLQNTGDQPLRFSEAPYIEVKEGC